MKLVLYFAHANWPFFHWIINVIPFLVKLVKCRLMEENITSKKMRRGNDLILTRNPAICHETTVKWAVVEIAEATKKSFGRLLITPLQCIQSCLTPILGISPSIGAVVSILKNYGQDCNLAVQWQLWKVSGQRERNIERRGERLRSKFPQINQSISSSVLTCHILCPFQNYLLFQEGINGICMNFLWVDRASKGKIVRAHGEIKEMIYSPVLVLLLSSL